MKKAPVPFGGAFAGRRVLVTGNTGFKGSWLSFWLLQLGARVQGLALPPGPRSVFHSLGLHHSVRTHPVDIRDRTLTARAVRRARPEFLFHFAAQSLVRRSYRAPHETFETNVMGTLNVLLAAAEADVPVVVCATSDKCYEKPESGRAFKETDPLGGHDPYSASKACQEIAAASVRDSFLGASSLSTVRAGNVIGGGDWAEDRIIPDCVRAFMLDSPAPLRNPVAIRPWQHVLEPLAGYMWLAAHQRRDPASFAGAWNFGPGPRAGALTVGQLAKRAARRWGDGARLLVRAVRNAPHEAPILGLNPAKARRRLGWRVLYSTAEAVDLSIDWYRTCSSAKDAGAFTRRQIDAYVARARAAGLPWANGAVP